MHLGRLGLGHPLLSQPASSRNNANTSYDSLNGLAKHLHSNKLNGKDSIDIKDPKKLKDEEDEDEEAESRSAVLGKGHKRMNSRLSSDPFAGKKKKRKNETKASDVIQDIGDELGSARIATNGIVGDKTSANRERETTSSDPIKAFSSRSQTSSPGGSGIFPFDGPISLSNVKLDVHSKNPNRVSPQRNTPLLDNPEDIGEIGSAGDQANMSEADVDRSRVEEGQEGSSAIGGEGKKSKTQMRREKRKQRKLGKKGNLTS